MPDGDHAAFVARPPECARPLQGAIVDVHGRAVGAHDGVHHFTVGQRKGLRLSVGVPLYVVAIDAEASEVMVGPRAALEERHCTVQEVNWIAGRAPDAPIRVEVQIRHRHPAAPASVLSIGSGAPPWSSTRRNSRSRRARPPSSTTATRCWAVGGLQEGRGVSERCAYLLGRVMDVGVAVLEPPLGVDGGHAARAGRRDGLPIDVVLHVAAANTPGTLVRVPCASAGSQRRPCPAGPGRWRCSACDRWRRRRRPRPASRPRRSRRCADARRSHRRDRQPGSPRRWCSTGT